jgi:hypothetical protein
MSITMEKEMADWTKQEKESLPSQYGCELIYERATLELAKDPTLPSDAYLVYYEVDGNVRMDVCRGSRKVDIFDLYYDKFGPGSLKKICWGYGKKNPKLWGYKAPEKKKRS